jgi:hypothetical protein
VTVRLTYIFIDYPDCEYIIILNTSIVIYDFWRLSFLLNEQRISALDLQKHIFPSGSSPTKSTCPWMQRHYVNYYKGEQLVWSKPTWNSLNTPACKLIILNTSIVIYDFWRLSFLLSSTPSMSIFGNRYRQKACLLTNTFGLLHYAKWDRIVTLTGAYANWGLRYRI